MLTQTAVRLQIGNLFNPDLFSQQFAFAPGLFVLPGQLDNLLLQFDEAAVLRQITSDLSARLNCLNASVHLPWFVTLVSFADRFHNLLRRVGH
jgi:hypothetical protein